MRIGELGMKMIVNYVGTNWILLLLPLVASLLLCLLYKKDKAKFKSIDSKVFWLASQTLVIFILTLVSVILLGINNALLVVVIMVATGEFIHLILILINSAELLDSKRKKYWRIVREEYRKYFDQKRVHHKKIMKGEESSLEQNEYKRKEEIIGCATITILFLAIYSFFNGEYDMACVFLSYLTGRFMWMDGGIVEGLSSIYYYIIKELRTVFVLGIIWCVNYLTIEKLGCDMNALYFGLIPVIIGAIIMMYKHRKK